MSFSKRLKEEKKRLKENQGTIAKYAGITEKSVGAYERGENNPPCSFLEKIAPYGFDVQYILTGVRSDAALSPDERELLTLYKKAPETIKQAVRAVLLSGGNGTEDEEFLNKITNKEISFNNGTILNVVLHTITNPNKKRFNKQREIINAELEE